MIMSINSLKSIWVKLLGALLVWALLVRVFISTCLPF